MDGLSEGNKNRGRTHAFRSDKPQDWWTNIFELNWFPQWSMSTNAIKI